MPKQAARDASSAATEQICDALIHGDSRVVIAKAPPGAGKTTTSRLVTRRLLDSGMAQVPIVVQTNAQADDLMLALAHEGLTTGRLCSQKLLPESTRRAAGTTNLSLSTKIADLRTCQVVVAPAAKWIYLNHPSAPPPTAYPLAIIDEAYQMRGDDLFRSANLFQRALAIGDPGQLDPFTIADDRRFAGQAQGPLDTAAGTLEASYPDAPVVEMPVSWRLPESAVPLVRDAFYEIDFFAATGEGERSLHVDRLDIGSTVDAVIDRAVESGWGYLELPARFTLRTDEEMVTNLANVVRRLFERDAQTSCELVPGGRRLVGRRVAVGTVHRDQADLVRSHLTDLVDDGAPIDLLDVTVDTANRLQGREYDVVVVWHPLAGRRDASEFHLEAGRLCVLLSRHRHACIVVGRAGIGDLLDSHPTEVKLYLNLPADVPDGWEANHSVLAHLLGHRL